MDTCLRGFSFMPDMKGETTDLQYISSGELERTWKTSRRQRLKQQEQKVWDDFIKEQDILKSVYKDDPYQFLHELPESCLKELMEAELQKARKEVEDKKKSPKSGEEAPLQDECARDEAAPAHTVTFADEPDDCDMFHIFDDDKDEPSGLEDEVMNDSLGSPCTVRERDSENNSPLPHERDQNKSPENVSNVIESSIYCAKVKDLRLKINDEMLAIMASLERQDVMSIERDEVSRTCRRAAEFSARFARIHVYQLQRQMADVKRNTLHSPPFAKHTHFHAQMVRVASLHHSLLHAFQVFHKSIERTACVRSSAGSLHSLGLAAREASALCDAVPKPAHLAAAHSLYDDEMLATCDKLDEAVCEHSLRVADFLSTTENTSQSPSRKSKGKGKRRMRGPSTKSTKSIPDTEARLSMYSLDTLRLNLNATSSGTSKMRCQGSATGKPQNKEPKSKSPKRSPRSRRPLMRAGGGGGGGGRRARPRPPTDTEITTMVEAVETCTSSRMSREPSPRAAAAAADSNRTHRHTPRTARTNLTTPRKSQTTTPRRKLRTQSPKAKIRRGSPEQNQLLKALGSIESEAPDSAPSGPQVTPVVKIQPKRDPVPQKRLNIAKQIDKRVDKPDKGIDKMAKDVHRGRTDKIDNRKDFGSGRDVDSKGLESVKDFDSFKDFDSGKDFGSGKSVKEFDSGKNFETTASSCKDGKEVSGRVGDSPRSSKREEERDSTRSDRERRVSSMAPARCEVTRLLKQLCSGDGSGSRNERVSGAKNAQLFCVTGGSPRQPSTPQLLRILEETIQKKVPRPMYESASAARDPARYRMTFNIPADTADSLLRYRTAFVQHMLASPLYANSAVGKPWEMIGSVSEKIIDDVLMACAKEMQIRDVLQQLYSTETDTH